MPIDGQPKSIVRELEDMARSYIKAGPMTSGIALLSCSVMQDAFLPEAPVLKECCSFMLYATMLIDERLHDCRATMQSFWQ